MQNCYPFLPPGGPQPYYFLFPTNASQPATPADTLRHLLGSKSASQVPLASSMNSSQMPVASPMMSQMHSSMSPPIEVGKPPVAPPVSIRKKIYQTLRPPLQVVQTKKVGFVSESDGPIAFTEVLDPEGAEKYILCGECDSLRLFRNLGSLFKHRVRNCSGCSEKKEIVPSVTPPVVDQASGLETAIEQTRVYLKSLPLEELLAEARSAGVNTTTSEFTTNVSTNTLVETIIKAALSSTDLPKETIQISDLSVTAVELTPATAPSSVVNAGTQMSSLLETQPVEVAEEAPTDHPIPVVPADVPPIDPKTQMNQTVEIPLQYTLQANKIREYFPTIHPHFLLLALISGCAPCAPRHADAFVQTEKTSKPKVSIKPPLDLDRREVNPPQSKKSHKRLTTQSQSAPDPKRRKIEDDQKRKHKIKQETLTQSTEFTQQKPETCKAGKLKIKEEKPLPVRKPLPFRPRKSRRLAKLNQNCYN